MVRRRFIMAGGAILAALFGLLNFAGSSTAENLTLEALSGDTLASDPSLLLVDIRTPEEWQQTGVIEGALLVTYTGPESFLAAVRPKLAAGQRIALICRTGNRTSRAAQQIAPLLDVPVIDVQGGMVRVLQEGHRPTKPTREMGCQIC